VFSGSYTFTTFTNPSSEKGIVLRDGDSLSSTTKYVTLSHCWGELEITKLTQISHFTFSNVSIPLMALPLTFQQVISVTKTLGIDYIWMESLCVIQDSYEDWLRESSQMWEVYCNSYCNLAATASFNGRGGLFRTHDHFQSHHARSAQIGILWKTTSIVASST
jgi:Heterokaryon incompatibility protein (HET)